MRTLKLEKREEKTKAMEEIGKLQQALKLKTMKNDHLEDQIEELKNNHMVCVCTPYDFLVIALKGILRKYVFRLQ